MEKNERTITIISGAEGIKNFDDALDKEVIRLTKGRKVKEYTEEELEEKKRKTEEDYNKIAKRLNAKYKNPERAISRKHSKKKKFGADIVKRLNSNKRRKEDD